MNEEVTDERAQLLQALREALGPHFSTNSAVLSCLQLADIATLRSHVERATRDGPGRRDIYLKFKSTDGDTIKALKDWSTRTRVRNQLKRKFEGASASRSSSPSKIPRPTTDKLSRESARTASPPPEAKGKESSQQGGRPEYAKDACEKRDNGECLVTKTGSLVEKAHIFPYSLGQRPQTALEVFWFTLLNFWSEERVAAWKSAVTGRDGTEKCANLMSFATHVHGAWAKAFFALKPISLSEDCKTMEVQVFWLEQSSFASATDLIPGRLSPADFFSGPKNFKLFDCETNGLIRSGHLITISTDDPKLCPLPSMALLDMQWVLHRALAMSGAAEATEDDYDESDDYVCARDLQEVEGEPISEGGYYESDDDASAGDFVEVEEDPIAKREFSPAAPR
ncbi:hypothetical protein PHISP_07941 [Aspergillus sp. HF37]|nr:hypothetical protein PHISP_07941 [Aspergillus sp. HF37]